MTLEPVKNIAYACTTKQCEAGNGSKSAFRWISSNLDQREVTFGEIEIESNRIANVLLNLGVHAGDTVSIFLPRSPELVYAFFGILKIQAVACILFSTFGENSLLDRLQNSRTRVAITKKSLLKKILNIQDQVEDLKSILVIDLDEDADKNVLSLTKAAAQTCSQLTYQTHVPASTPFLLQYTSGSTGKPKGALHVHGGLSSMLRSYHEVFDLQADEIFWCTADPAWITGIVYGIIAPMATAVLQIQYGGLYHAEKWLGLLQSQRINIWYTAPTALRMLMQEENDFFKQFDISQLRKIFSVGEPLNSEIIYWGRKVFNQEIYDTYFQSETGSIMVANRPGLPIRPGSMGRPVSEVSVHILDQEFRQVPTGMQGQLCLESGWASMFQDYYQNRELYGQKFYREYYITGDLAWKDQDGYIWYVSRADDVINTAGHLVGPFEVESALLEIEEVGDVAIIGVPDAILHEKIVAFLSLRKNCTWNRELELKCRLKVSNRVSSLAIPQEFRIIDKIPKNKSGKILRRVLKAWYEGRDPGDLSTMED